MPIGNQKHINLLPQDEFQSTSVGRALAWALSSFRVMVIITELIVMSAFLSRFWLDSKNSDLNEEININKAQVMAYSETEDEFRSYQNKISIAKSYYSLNSNTTLIKSVSDLIPADLVLTSIQKNDDGLQIKAVSYSERSIAQFLVNLGSLKNLTDINLTQVVSSSENSALTSFTITAKLIQALERTK